MPKLSCNLVDIRFIEAQFQLNILISEVHIVKGPELLMSNNQAKKIWRT